MPKFGRKPYKFVSKGLNVAKPIDLLEPGEYPVLKNVRVLRDGQLDDREGMAAVNGSAIADHDIHTMRRLNATIGATFLRFLGAGTSVYAGTTAFTSKKGGFSGNPLSMIPFRPDRSPDPFLYVGDSSQMQKFGPDGTAYSMGIVPPAAEPYAYFGQPINQTIADFNNSASYGRSGTAGALSNVARFNQTISQILYDSGTTGWASVVPSAMDKNYQAGALVIVNAGGGTAETRAVRKVFNAVPNTTIGSILYDTGATGLCSIVLASTTNDLQPDCVLLVDAEYVRVLSVTTGPNGVTSLRCNCASTHAAGDAVTGKNSFRVYLFSAHVATETLTGNATQSTIATGTGAISLAGAQDLSTISSRPVDPDDYIYLSIQADTSLNIVEGRLVIDISNGSFNLDYFYYAFRASDIQSNVVGSLSAITTSQQQQQTDIILGQINALEQQLGTETSQDFQTQQYLGDQLNQLYTQLAAAQGKQAGDQTSSTPLVPGNNSWTVLRIKVADLVRVGNSQAVSLKTTAAVEVSFTVSGSTTILLQGWWMGGTYGPDTGQQGSPLLYTTRYRSFSNGAKSNPSPVTRMSLDAKRETIGVAVVASNDPQVDRIDLCRFGGGEDKWRVVGSFPNATATVTDNLTPLAIQANELVGFDNYQPFPVSDLPRTGTCNVAGTSVQWVSGDVFNGNWVPGSQIVINGTVYALSAPPTSTTRLEITQSAGSGTGVTFLLQEPTLAAQPLPGMWGFGGQGIGTFLFGVGDQFDPGFLRWCKGNDADAASDKGNLEVTSPSEPLMNGCEYDGRAFVFSTERLFSILPDSTGVNQFAAQVVLNNKGLFARWALCATPQGIAFVGKDGVYLWAGGAEKNLTDATLYPLFPHGEVAGKAANGYLAVDYSQPNLMKLAFAANALYFTYVDTGGTYRTLRYDFSHPGWYPYDFTPAAHSIYMEEGEGLETVLVGGGNGVVYIPDESLTTDGGTAITHQIRTACVDLDDSRVEKLWMDAMLDADPQGSTFTVTMGFDNNGTTITAQTMTGGSRTQQSLPLAGTSLTLYRNICADITWTGPGTLYEWQPGGWLQPFKTRSLVVQYTGLGMPNYGHEKEAWIGVVSTGVVTFTITVDGTAHAFTLASTGGLFTKTHILLPPLKGKLWGYKLTADADFIPFTEDCIVHHKQWGMDAPFQPVRPFEGVMAQ